MKQNKYDDEHFFAAYEKMPRSEKGLEAAGEWHILKTLLPDMKNKRVLDLGCGFGWHCRYAREQQASAVVGVDLSEKMIKKARQLTDDPYISYIQMPIEDVAFSDSSFDIVFSSLAFHYMESFEDVCKKVYRYLKPQGSFVFSVEHPIFTARQEQDWHYDEQGNKLHWPLDHYQSEGIRHTSFLTENVVKYHRTLATYINDLLGAGFQIRAVNEPTPSEANLPDMKDELRRPMFLIISAYK